MYSMTEQIRTVIDIIRLAPRFARFIKRTEGIRIDIDIVPVKSMTIETYLLIL
jgi:hypothetical protein